MSIGVQILTCVYQKPYPCFDDVTESPKTGGMIGLLCFLLAALASPFKSKIRLEAENAALRHQLIVLRRKLRGRVKLANSDRWFFIQLYRWFPSFLKVLTVIRPEKPLAAALALYPVSPGRTGRWL